MTLNLTQYFVNIITREAKISHFLCKIFCGKPSKLKSIFKNAITKKYGEKYLLDADYILIFTGGDITQHDSTKSLYKLVDTALGKTANNISQSDLKYVKLSTSDVDDKSTDNNDEIDSNMETSFVEFYFVKVTLK